MVWTPIETTATKERRLSDSQGVNIQDASGEQITVNAGRFWQPIT